MEADALSLEYEMMVTNWFYNKSILSEFRIMHETPYYQKW